MASDPDLWLGDHGVRPVHIRRILDTFPCRKRGTHLSDYGADRRQEKAPPLDKVSQVNP